MNAVIGWPTNLNRILNFGCLVCHLKQKPCIIVNRHIIIMYIGSYVSTLEKTFIDDSQGYSAPAHSPNLKVTNHHMLAVIVH